MNEVGPKLLKDHEDINGLLEQLAKAAQASDREFGMVFLVREEP
jgi:hypothetical protein